MTVNFYLARHGQTKWNIEQRYQGQLDSELTPLGQKQSADIATQLINKNIDVIAYSPLGRSAATALICQQKLVTALRCETGLIERNLGQWQGQYNQQVKSDDNYHELLHQYTELSPEGGESAVACGERIYQTLTSLAKANENSNILVVFHGEALRCFLEKLGVKSTGNAYQLFDNGCVVELSYQLSSNCFTLIS